MRLQMASPRPEPDTACPCKRLKGSKIWAAYSGRKYGAVRRELPGARHIEDGLSVPAVAILVHPIDSLLRLDVVPQIGQQHIPVPSVQERPGQGLKDARLQ